MSKNGNLEIPEFMGKVTSFEISGGPNHAAARPGRFEVNLPGFSVTINASEDKKAVAEEAIKKIMEVYFNDGSK